MKIEGIIIPLVTPFKDNRVDFVCYKKLIDYYIDQGVDGIIPLGTTGESPTIESFEYNEILLKTMEYNNGRTKVYVGLGGILASASLNTKSFIKVYNDMKSNDYKEALKTWREISKVIPLLFNEPNPTPLKYCLKNMGLIDSDEVRLPLTNIADELKYKLDNMLFSK
ncbi:hypothetical protein ST12_15470 [Clostridium botulinum]|uniref:dihydrodipicolinate synthase family protein n=1 Tax=Clostridium botulinum TaxID=1491 RepID=UPI0005955C4C|nr:dihydrodipicolinate synthase family protein [Clostridium botulinum]AJF31047.1 hypothetical protein ST13_15470 [Clostridium botulinum]AJF34109.1 hypothetical protein ST12_15470 [Clostridium botulinum]NFI33496.1 hypothetical protein [Clostridium botulinum]